jgi:hypothetical protein
LVDDRLFILVILLEFLGDDEDLRVRFPLAVIQLFLVRITLCFGIGQGFVLGLDGVQDGRCTMLGSEGFSRLPVLLN